MINLGTYHFSVHNLSSEMSQQTWQKSTASSFDGGNGRGIVRKEQLVHSCQLESSMGFSQLACSSS
jgi:hypothetical protein